MSLGAERFTVSINKYPLIQIMESLSSISNQLFGSFPVPIPNVPRHGANTGEINTPIARDASDAGLTPSVGSGDLKEQEQERDQLKNSFDDAYDDLQNLANWLLRSERSALTLQSDDLVHEAYLRLTRSTATITWENRRQLINLIVETMRRILIDHARRKSSLRGGGAHSQVPWEDVISEHASEDSTSSAHLFDLNTAITKLAGIHKSAAEVVNLRFFAGLTFDEISSVLEKPRSTIYREWLAARAWLKTELTRSSDS